jgi:nucleotide sugar dehydrogenase|tara:strand:+ start:7285 stop:8460 length:1176 start_codon:yes stop_codon:yes gene_type:complete
MKIGVIGAGRLGICFALLCEEAGYDVLVSDIREDYVNSLNDREIVTNEPEVSNLLKTAKNFRATASNREVIEECDLIYTLVATPSLPDGSYNVSSVWDVVKELKNVIGDDALKQKRKYFVVGCTTNPGDCDQFQEYLPNCVKVMYNPEFIAQGSIIQDLRTADMVLLGRSAFDESIDSVVDDIEKLYRKIQTTRAIVCTMTNTAAEVTKIAINCFLTTKISYANMLGDVLRQAGCGDEITSVLGAVGMDSRIGKKYLGYGFGYGGPCLPRDNRAFAAFAKAVGLDYNLGFVTDEINNQHAKYLCDYYESMCKNAVFYFDSVAYKKGTDIITESQQLRLATDLLDRGHKVYIRNDHRVVSQIRDDLFYRYGERVRFVDGKNYIKEPVFIVNL